jgi:xylulokinase
MNDNSLVLAVDLGTTTCKTLVVDSQLCVVVKDAVEYPVSTPRAGWAEQDPEMWWRTVEASLGKVAAQLRASGHSAEQVRAIGLSGQMHGLVLLDEKNSPVRPAILWNDQRSAPQCREVYEKAGGVEGLLSHTNNPMLPGYTGGKLLWVREHEPENYQRTRRFCMPKDYIRYRMTGQAATDVSDASGTGLFDVRSRRWASELLDRLALAEEWFPQAHESGEILGEVGGRLSSATGLAAGIPVIAGGGDAVMQTVGSGAADEKVVLLVIGTGGNVTVSLPRPIENSGARLQVFCHVAPEQWVGMGVTLCAGSSLRWFRDTLGGLETALARDLGSNAYALLSQEAARAPAGSNGLLFLPYLQGERAPHADANARGVFIGLGLHTDKADIVRAVLEGVCFSLRDVLDLILKAGIDPQRVNVSGGGSASAVWRQILADVFDRPVTTLDFSEDAGAIGAAIVAGAQAGVWSSVGAAAGLIQTRTVDHPDAQNISIYRRSFEIYKSLYPALKPSFDRMAG